MRVIFLTNLGYMIYQQVETKLRCQNNCTTVEHKLKLFENLAEIVGKDVIKIGRAHV